MHIDSRALRRHLIGALGVGAVSVALVACGSTPVPTAGPSFTAAPSLVPPPGTASAAASGSGVAPSLGSSPIPSGAVPSGSPAVPAFSFPSEVKDLEARLPSQVNGVTLVKYSWNGPDFLASGSDTQDVQELLNQLGKQPTDISVAFAGDPNGDLDVTIGAFRVGGAEANPLLGAFLGSIRKASPEDQFNQLNLGGKNVTQVVEPGDDAATVYVYASGDTLFYVQSGDQALAAAALEALP